MADPPLIVRLIMRIAELPEEVARLILGELPRYCPTRGRLITMPTLGLPRPAPIFPEYGGLMHWMPTGHRHSGFGWARGQFDYNDFATPSPTGYFQPWGYLQ